MTPKQEKFCLEYLKTGNASEAYRRAYNTAEMKPASINRKAKELMDNGKIAASIAALRKPAIEGAKLSKQWVLDRLMSVAERCRQVEPVQDRQGHPVLVKCLDGSLKAAFTFDAAGANRSLELLGKEQGMFIDRKEVGDPGAFDKLDDDELTRAAIEADKVISDASSSSRDGRKVRDSGIVEEKGEEA